MWDCVSTCFFIDTAHNVLDYIETIWNILKPGGVWINLGKSQILHNHFQSNVICKWKAENTCGWKLFVFVLKGPLLYHYENMANELSIELSYEEIKAVILKYGFVLEVNS